MPRNNPTGAPHGIRTPAAVGAGKREAFLAHLAETCNVTAACRIAGVDFSSMYRLRRRDAAFAARWLDAVEEGYLRIESELMRRALGAGAPVEAVAGDHAAPVEAGAGSAGAPVETDARPAAAFNPELAFKVLLFRARADRQGRRSGVRLKQPDPLDALAALDRKLRAIEKKLGRRS